MATRECCSKSPQTTVSCPFCSVHMSDITSTVTLVAHKAFTSSRQSVFLLHTWLSPEGDESASYLTGGRHVCMYKDTRAFMHTDTHTYTWSERRKKDGLIPGEKLESGHESLPQKARSISPQGDHLSRSSLPYSPSNLSDCSGGISLP